MKVTNKDVSYVADLANLELAEEERAHMLRDLNSILEYIDRLSALDTDTVAPMAQVSDRCGVDKSQQGSQRFAGMASRLWQRCGGSHLRPGLFRRHLAN